MSDNTSTSSTPTITVTDNSAPSFDALESIISTPDIKLEAEVKSDKATPKTEKADSAEGSPKQEQKTTALPTTQEAKDNSQEKGEKAPETKEAEAAKVESEPTKEFKFRVGPKGKEVALPPDAKISIPVDGQEVEVTLEDLKREFNGKTVWEKKFSELDNNWKSFKQDKEQTEKQLNGILNKAYNKDVLGSILDMVEIAELDPKPVFEHIRDELIGDIEKYVQMTPEQRELHWLKKELEFMSRDKQSSAEKKKSEQAQAELQASVSKLRETLDVSDDWISKAKAELEANPELAKQYLGDDKAKHAEKTVQLADTLRRQELSIKSLSLVKPEFADNMALVGAAMEHLNTLNRAELKNLDPNVFAKQIAEYLGVPMGEKQVDALAEKAALAKKASENEQIEEPKVSKKSSKKDDDSDDFDPRGWDRL